jgi:TolB-like protein
LESDTHLACCSVQKTSSGRLKSGFIHPHNIEKKRYARTMSVAGLDTQTARVQLKRVLASSGFARNERLSRFLQFVVEKHLDGRHGEIKESVIAVEVFGRRPDHDPKHDSIVRTEATRLRARLREYYVSEGKQDEWIIGLPKGGYSPVFLHLGTELASTSDARRASHGQRWPARMRPLVVAAGLAIVAFAIVSWVWIRRQNVPIRVAVLPLLDLSHDGANQYFADGVTGEIIRDLSIIDGLAVRSQTSSFALRGKFRSVREAGAQLGADYILEGSVLRVGQRVRINAQFVRVRDDFALWSDTYDRELVDVLRIQDEISRGIVNSLRLKLGRGRRRYEISAAAYDCYLRARALTIQRGLPGWVDSVPLFEQSIENDASFAPAYAGLAIAHVYRSEHPYWDAAQEMTNMRLAAHKAIQLDPLLAEAHDALGMVYARDGDWEQSERSFRRALELDPNLWISAQYFTMELLLPLGRIEEGLTQLRAAEKVDPLSAEVQFFLYYVLTAAGRFDDAAKHCNKVPQQFWAEAACQADGDLRRGNVHHAIEILEPKIGQWGNGDGFLGCAYVRAGLRSKAEQLANSESTQALDQARIFACLKDKDRALDALDRGAAAGPIRVGRALAWPELSVLRGDPRLKTLRIMLGLPE